MSVVVAPALLRSWLSPFQLFPVLLLFLQTSAAHQQPRISKEKLGGKEGKKKIVKDKAWEEVKRGNHIFGHGPRRRERLPQSAVGEAGKGRGQEEGLSGGQGHGVGWRSDQLGIHLPPPLPPPLAALEDCGGKGLRRCVRPRGPCGPSQPPRGETEQSWWGGRWGSDEGEALWSLASGPADMPDKLSHVYDGIFLLLRQSASSTP